MTYRCATRNDRPVMAIRYTSEAQISMTMNAGTAAIR
jgi:hypothetical protein